MHSLKRGADDMLNWLGTCVFVRRLDAGLAPSELARKAHLKTKAISQIELGQYNGLTVRELYAIARALGSTMSDIFRPVDTSASFTGPIRTDIQ